MGSCSSIETAVVIDSSQDGCGFDLKRSGGSWSSSHRGVKFGTSIAPAPRKNQDRCSQQRIDLSGFPNAGGSLMYGFGLFDGHGKSSAIAELAAEKLLKSLSKVISSTSPLSGMGEEAKCGPSIEEGVQKALDVELFVQDLGSEKFDAHAVDLLNRSFSHIRNQLDEFQGMRVGSTATVVLLSRAPGATEWRVTCGWVGDSRGIVVGPDKKQVTALSEDHRLDLEREHQRCLEMQRSEAATAMQGRRRTVVAHRVCNKTGEKGPKVLFNEGTGVSTMVTRSLGDSLGASALSDKPEFTHVTVAAGSRLVLASDGVWDVMSNDKVALTIRSIADPVKAARALCKAAKNTRLYGGFSPDDISAVVINLERKIE